MLGGREGELGEVRGGAEGWEALRFLRPLPNGTRTCFAVGDQVFGDLAAPTGSCRRLGGHGVVCKAMLRSWEAGQRKKGQGDPQVGLPGAPALF